MKTWLTCQSCFGSEFSEEKLEVQCKGLQEQVKDLKRKLNETTSMKTNLEQKKTELAGEKSSLQGHLQNVEEALKTSSLACARLQTKVSQLNSEVLAARTSRNKFQTSCQTLANKEKELEDSLRSTKGELAASRREVEENEVTISGQLAKLKDKVQELHSETSAKNLAKGSVTRLDTQCKMQEAELVHLKKEVAQLEAKKSKLVNNLSAETEAKEALQKNVKKLEEENIKAEKEIGRMTNIVDYVKMASKTKDEEYEKLDRQYKEVVKDGKENIQLTEKLKDAEASHEKAMAMHRTATKEKEELSRKVEELERKKVELTKTVASNETTKMDLGDRLESLELKLHLKEEEVTELRATIERNEVRIQDAKEELRDLEKYRKRVQELKNLLREANTKASEDETTISELKTKRNSQTTEESQQRQDIEGPLLVEINTLKERLSQRETDLQSSNGRISELERDIDASKACSAELQSELKHTSTELTSTLAELNNTHHDGLKKAQEQNEASSSRCQELEQQCQELRQHIAELESVQDRLQKREEDLNQQVEVLKFERDTAQRQAQDFDRDGRDFKLKLQKTQSDYENEQRNCDRERDTTQGLRTEISQLIDRISSLEREVQALKEKGRHRREVMQQVVKSMQAQVTTVRSDLDQERSRQSDLKDSVEQLLTRSYIVRFLKTELVSRAAELQKCRDKLQKCGDELKTTTAERDKLNQSETSAASQVSMQQQLHQFQEHVTQSLGQVHDCVAKVAADVSAVPELNRGVQQLHRQMSSSSSLDQSSMSGQQLTSRSQKLGSAIDSDEHLDPDLMTSDASSDVPITGQQRTLSLARLQPTPEEDPGLETVTSIASDLPDNGNGHHQLSPDSSPSSVDPHTTEVTASPIEERDLVADLSRPTGPEHEMRTNSPDVSRMDRQPAISHYRQPSASDHHQPSVRNRHQPSISDRHQPSVNDRDPQSFRDHPPRPWSEDNMDPLPINGPNPSLPTRIAGQRTPFSNVVSYSTFPFQTNLMSLGGFHLVPVPMSFPNTSVMPSHDDPSPMSLPSSSQSGSSFPMHGGRDSSLSATVATSLQDSVDPALLKKRITKLSELMPYVPDLAHKVPQIAGYLDMYTKLQALKQTCSDPEIHLQELLSQWLEGQEDEERPHYWEYFITLVKAVDQYPVVRRIYIDLAAGQTKS